MFFNVVLSSVCTYLSTVQCMQYTIRMTPETLEMHIAGAACHTLRLLRTQPLNSVNLRFC